MVRLIAAHETYPLRSLVLRPGKPLAACAWEGDEGPENFHVGGFVGEELVCIASMLLVPMPCHVEEGRFPSPTYRLRGMATHPEHRGRGIATAVLAECVNQAQLRGAEAVWCNARTGAVSFYEQNGWQTLGEVFDVLEIGPHVIMWIDLHRFAQQSVDD